MPPLMPLILNIDEILDPNNKDVVITPVIPNGNGGYSGEVSFVKHKGQKYVLRTCKNGNPDKNVERYAFYCDILNREREKAIPKLLARKQRHLLFEFLEGKDCTPKNAGKAAFQAGRICAQATKIPLLPKYERDMDKVFHTNLDYLLENKLITHEKHKQIKQRYQELRPENLETQSELIDTTLSNFRITPKGLYLVDIESITTDVKGRCFARAYLRSFKNHRKEFRAGYNSIADSSFLTPEYLQYLYLNFLIKNASGKHKKRKKYPELNNGYPLEKLDLLLQGKLN